MSSPVPQQFTGLTRKLRSALELEDIEAYRKTASLTLPLVVSARHKNPLRPKMLAKTADGWRALPATGRLLLEIELRKKSLTIRELRLMSATTRFNFWDEGEQELGFCIVATGLVFRPGHMRFDPVRICALSLHSISRFFERVWPAEVPDLLASLTQLALCVDDARLNNLENCNLAGGWRGHPMVLDDCQNEKVLAVRTYTPS